jgi:hypothetical protein
VSSADIDACLFLLLSFLGSVSEAAIIGEQAQRTRTEEVVEKVFRRGVLSCVGATSKKNARALCRSKKTIPPQE